MPGSDAGIPSLLDSVERLHETLHTDAVAKELLAAVARELAVKRCVLYLGASDSGRLEPRGGVGLDGSHALAPIGADSNLVRWLKDAGRPVHLDEFYASSGGVAGGDEETMLACVHAGLSHGIALIDQGTLLGVLLCGGTASDGRSVMFDDESLARLSRAASRALGNASAHETAVASLLERERFSEAKRELIERSSRDLRTSLTVVMSSLWSLEPEGAGDTVLVDMARDAIAGLRSAVDRIASLGDVELGAAGFNFEPSEVSGLVEEALREIIPELEEKHIRVSASDGAIDRKAMIDAGKVRFVVRSILETAVEHTARGGTIQVMTRVAETRPGAEEGMEIGERRARHAHLGDGAIDGRATAMNERAAKPLPTRSVQELGGSPYVVITIVEGGGEISPEEIRSLTERPDVLPRSIGTSATELLPGLSVSREIIAGHGGRLFCKSEPAQGMRFSIWLPLSV